MMEGGLKKNICDLDDYVSLDKVKDLPTRRETQIGGALEYACRFWAKHLSGTPSSGHGVEEVHNAIDEFFTKRLLFWIEASPSLGILTSHLLPLTTSGNGIFR